MIVIALLVPVILLLLMLALDELENLLFPPPQSPPRPEPDDDAGRVDRCYGATPTKALAGRHGYRKTPKADPPDGADGPH